MQNEHNVEVQQIPIWSVDNLYFMKEAAIVYIIIGVVFIGIGLLMMLSPSIFYNITQGWKNGSESEPSNLFIVSTRFGGVMFSLIGTASIVLQFLL